MELAGGTNFLTGLGIDPTTISTPPDQYAAEFPAPPDASIPQTPFPPEGLPVQAVPNVDDVFWNFDAADPHLPPDEERKVIKDIHEKLQRAITERKPIEDKWATAKKQIDSRLSRDDVVDPGVQSNIDIGITKERSDAVIARIINPILQQKPRFTCEPAEAQYNDLAGQAEEYIEILLNRMPRGMTFRKVLQQALRDLHTFTFAAIKITFLKQHRTIREWVVREEVLQPPVGIPGMGPATGVAVASLPQSSDQMTGGMVPPASPTGPPMGPPSGMPMGPPQGPPAGPSAMTPNADQDPNAILPPPEMTGFSPSPQTRLVGSLEPRDYVEFEGAMMENVNPENLVFYPLKSPSLQSAEIVSERIYMAPFEVRRLIRSGYFRSKIPSEPGEDAKNVMDCLKLEPITGETEGEARKTEEKELGVSQTTADRYQLMQVYAVREEDDDTDPSGKSEREYIIVFDWNSKTVLRFVENFYADYRIPIVTSPWEEVYNSIFGKSFCEPLEGPHRAFNASINQRLDMGSFAAGNAFVTDDDDLADDLEDQIITPHRVLRVTRNSKESLTTLQLAQPMTQLPELEAIIERHADMCVSLNTGSLGGMEEERPTATGTVRRMEEAQMPLFGKLDQVREFLATVILVALSRCKQFYPTGSDYQTIGPDGQLTPHKIVFPPGLIEKQILIRVTASTNELNESARKQEVVALVDRIKDFTAMASGLLSKAGAPTPDAPAQMALVVTALRSLTRLYSIFRVERPSELTPDIEKEMAYGAGLVQQLQKQQAVIAQLTQALQPPPGGPGSVPGAPPAPEGGQGGNQPPQAA